MNNEEKTNKTRGRPKKRKRLPVSTASRKPVSIKKASYSTKWRLAKDVLALVNNNTDILEMAIRVHSKKKSKPEEEIDEEEIDVKENCSAHSSQTALAFYLENDLNKKSYSALVKDCRSRNAPIYPSYPQLQKEMAHCRPIGCINSEIQVVVPLQQMLNKTVERLCEAVALKWNENHLCDTELHVTMGFDSSSGHVNPHQHCSDPINKNLNSQNSLFVSSFIIIKLSCSFCEKCSWINPTPQSVRFCRPLRIALEKEDEEATMREYRRLNGEIDALLRHTFQMQNGKIVTAKFIVSQTLFDGKCINTILGNRATMKCPLCDKPTRSFSNLTDDFTPVQTSLKLGLGLLHAEIKSFEHLLHISYRLTIKMWDVKKEFRETMVIQKIKIQKQIYSAIGVRVDQVLQGHGTTNTGNVARRCFKNPIKFAEALEIDAALVSNIALII